MRNVIRFSLLVMIAALSGARGAQAQAPSFSATLVSDTSLTIDSNRCADGPQYSYVAFKLTNTGLTISSAYVDLTGQANGIAVANGQPTTQYMGTWYAGQTRTFYWYMQYPCTELQSASLGVKVTNSTAGTSTTVNNARPVTTRKMLSSNGGGQLSSGSVGPGAIIGQVITADVAYIFGGVSAGDTYHMQPAGTSALFAQCFQLVKSQVVASNITAIPATSASDDKLFFTATASQSGSGYTATVRYSFRYKCTGQGSQLQPYTNQLSGRQLKYSGNWSSFIGPTFPAATNPFTVSKTVSPVIAPNGGTVTYTITIRNPSTFASKIDSIADVLPAGVTFSSISASSGVTVAKSSRAPSAGATGTLKFVGITDSTYSIAAGDSLKLVYTATVTSTPGVYTNTATAYIADVTLGTSSADVTVGIPDVSITKSHSGNFTTGTNGTYTIAVKNTGTAAATSVIVTDTLPAGLSYVSGASTRGSWTFANAGQVVTATLTGTVATGDSAKLTLTVLPALAALPSITNIARVSAAYETNTANNSASDATTVLNSSPDLSIAKSATNSFVQGSNANYTITVTNGGAATTANIVVVDTLPAGLTYVSGSGTNWTFTNSGQVVTATYAGPAIASSATSSFSLVASIGTAAVPSVTNRAYVSGGGDTNTANNGTGNVTSAVTGLPDLAVTTTSPASFTPGVNSTYTIKVDNVGTAATSGNITVTDTLPAGVSYVSLSGSGWALTSSGTTAGGQQWRVFTYSGAALAASTGTTTLTLTVSIANTGVSSVTNTARVSGTGDSNAANNAASVTTSINGADLTIAKSASTLTYGSNGTYTLTVTNAGNVATSGNIVVTDSLRAGLSYVSASGTGWVISQANGVVTATRSSALASGANSAFTITVNVSASTDSVTNTAYVSGGSQINTSNDNVTIKSAVAFLTPNLTLVKSVTSGASSGVVLPGADLTYNIHFVNTGAGNAVNVVINDNLPPQVYFKLNSILTTIAGGITANVQYFDGSSWTTSLADGGCGAPAGYNGCVTRLRWTLQTALPASAIGDLFFVVRVK